MDGRALNVVPVNEACKSPVYSNHWMIRSRPSRCINETLVAKAGSIFKSWFVDLDPVRADEGLPLEGMDIAETVI
jgi:hypothetical protein